MTPSQLPLSAHAPCTSTMLGLAPPPAAAAPAVPAVPADAVWLSAATKPAMATITAAIMSRSLPSHATRVMFTEVSFLVCRAPVRPLDGAPRGGHQRFPICALMV